MLNSKPPKTYIEHIRNLLQEKGYSKSQKYSDLDTDVWVPKDMNHFISFKTNVDPLPFEAVVAIVEGQMGLPISVLPVYSQWIGQVFRPDGTC